MCKGRALLFVLALSFASAGGARSQGILTSTSHSRQAVPQREFDSTLAANLQATIEIMRGALGCKGISAEVMIPGQGSWLGASGISHSDVGITPTMKFGIGSQTKTFIAALVLKLAEMHVLNLDDSLHRWLPHFENVDSTITIRQLLNHTSGVFDFVEKASYVSAMRADTGRRWTPEEIISTFVDTPYCASGGCWHYSNTNYLLVGLVIRAATGASVSATLRKLILDPFYLDNTFFPVEETVPDTIVHAWDGTTDLGGYPPTSWWSSFWTAGAMFSTTEDLTRFNRQLFGGFVISRSSLDQMLTFVPTGGFPPMYGLGMYQAVLNGRSTWGHPGSVFYRTVTSYDSAAGFIITVHTNTNTVDPLVIWNALDGVVLNSPVLGVRESAFSIPEASRLMQNYPNPFNPSTTIRYSVARTGFVSLKVYNTLGEELKTLVSEVRAPGAYTARWDATGLAGGVYYCRLQVGTLSEMRKLLLLK